MNGWIAFSLEGWSWKVELSRSYASFYLPLALSTLSWLDSSRVSCHWLAGRLEPPGYACACQTSHSLHSVGSQLSLSQLASDIRSASIDTKHASVSHTILFLFLLSSSLLLSLFPCFSVWVVFTFCLFVSHSLRHSSSHATIDVCQFIISRETCNLCVLVCCRIFVHSHWYALTSWLLLPNLRHQHLSHQLHTHFTCQV